jgi:hypothetical protein
MLSPAHRYRSQKLILCALLFLQIFSAMWFLPGMQGFGLSYFRILLAILFVYFMSVNGLKNNHKMIKQCLYILFSIIIIMTISLLWSKDIDNGFRQISYFISTLALLYVLDNLIKDKSIFIFCCKLIIALGFAICIFSFYELNTGYHLYSNILEIVANDLTLAYILENQAWATFGNPNDLAVHLTICISAYFMYAKYFKLLDVMMLIFFVISLIFIFININARLSIFCIIAFISIFYALKMPSVIRNITIYFCIFTFLVIITYYSTSAQYIYSKEYNTTGDLSLLVRARILLMSGEMALSSFLIGIGTGGFEAYIINSGMHQWTHFIQNPHNAFGRIFGENGVIGLILFILFVFPQYGRLSEKYPWTSERRAVAASVIILPLLLSSGSNPMSSSSLQTWIALLWVGSRVFSEHAQLISPAQNYYTNCAVSTS